MSVNACVELSSKTRRIRTESQAKNWIDRIEKQKDRELFVEQISVGSPKEDVGPESQITPASFERILEAMLKLDGGSLPTIILQGELHSRVFILPSEILCKDLTNMA